MNNIIQKYSYNFIPEPNTGCWLWIGANDGNVGYGKINSTSVWGQAHRVFYESVYGKLPDNIELDHICNIFSCVNPEHLIKSTHTANIRRKRTIKLSIEKAKEIRLKYNNGYSLFKLSQDYNVSSTQILNIVQDKHWKEEVLNGKDGTDNR